MEIFILCLFITRVFALDTEWWRHSTIYELYTASFMDSNGDGWGDFKGIASKLDYLKDLGVDALYLTPFNPSPMVDTGYDVSNYLSINPLFGSMADFNLFMKEMKEKDLKLIMDLVINHSSDKHKWFEKSVNKVKPYTDYYIWRDPKGYNQNNTPIEPNNWKMIFSSAPAWTWHEKRKQFFYHLFTPQQPDLNLRNSHLQQEIKKIMNFWMKKGVAGFRLDAANFFMEDESFADEGYWPNVDKNSQKNWVFMYHNLTANVPDTFDYIRQLRGIVDEFNSLKNNSYERILLLEAGGTSDDLKSFYGNATNPGAHFPINNIIPTQFDYLSPKSLNKLIDFWIEPTSNNTVLNWSINHKTCDVYNAYFILFPFFNGVSCIHILYYLRVRPTVDKWLFNEPYKIDNHDSFFRSSTKFIQEYIDIMLTVIALLPGVTFLYYGNEIGMTSGVLRNTGRWIFSEYSRGPMQWDGSVNAGFSSKAKTWSPVNPNNWRLNVEKEKSNKQSTYHFVQDLLKLKKMEVIKYGDLKRYILSEWVYSFKRSLNDKMCLVVLNLGTEREVVRLGSIIPELPPMLTLYLASKNSGLKKNTTMKKWRQAFRMKPMTAAVFCQNS